MNKTNGKKERKVVLIVEDEAALFRAISLAFTQADLDVIGAKNGEEGLNSALTQNPDLIILDMVMPGMSGITMLEKLREKEKEMMRKNIPVIVYTNLSENEMRSAAAALGVKDYLSKTEHRLRELLSRSKEILGTP